MSSDTHSAKRERAQAEGARERRLSFSSPSGLKCRAALPVPCASAPGPKSISLTHPPSLFHAVPRRHCKCECASTVFRFRYPRRHGLAVLTALYKVTILAVGYDDSPFPYGFIWTWDWLLGNSFYIFPIGSSRVSFSARPLSDVAASQVPSVAAAADLHFNHNSEDATLAVPIGFLSSFTYFLVFGVFHWSLFLLLWSIELGRTHRR